MKQLSLLGFLAFPVILFSCKAEIKERLINDVKIDVSDPKEILFSEIVDTCYFIPLDSRAVIGDVGWLQLRNENILILDPSVSKSVYLFDLNGHLISQIREEGEGPGKYKVPRYSSFTENKDQILIYDDAGPKILIFDKNGKFQNEISLSKYGQLNDLKLAKDGYWIYNRSGKFSNGNAIQLVDQDLSKIISSIPPLRLKGWEEDHGAQNSFYKSLSGENFYFQINTTSDLLEFNKTGLVSHIRFDFSSRGLDYSNSSINPYDLLHISRAQDLVFLGPNHIDLGDYMLLDLVDSGLGKMAIFDKKNGHARMVSRLVNDLSLMMNLSGIPGAYNNQPGYLTLAMPYGQFESIRSKLDFQDNPYREVIEKISSDDPESLVLMIYKFKTDLAIDLD